MQIAEEYHLYVVEDACQAINATYTFSDGRQKKAGCIGDIGCTSFFPSKNLGCYGDGGAVFTNDDQLAERMRAIANHGMVVRYHHDTVGVNSRLDSIQAAILNAKLPHLNDYTQKRQKAAEYYSKGLADNPHLLTPTEAPYSTHVFHQYTLRIADGSRDALREGLAEKGIPSMIYYPVPLHLQEGLSRPPLQARRFSCGREVGAMCAEYTYAHGVRHGAARLYHSRY